MKNKLTKKSGFTLVETLVTIAIFSILMIGITLMIQNIFTVSEQQNGILSNTNQATIIASTFVNELRNATYGANGAYPINQATSNQLIFFSTTPKNNGTVSQIRYYISGNTLYKGITNPAGNPLSYVGQPETITPLLIQMSMGGNSLFSYYDGNYNGSGNPLTQPVNINVVRFIQINLTVLKDATRNGTSTFSVTSGASLRNLKTNLGN
ncbi:MAG: type II secretion system protein [Candidatus Pacebacteria bacterium]|nr:type II secretion system protein [Candidatus Paceibacterota bacterium]